MPQKGTFCVQSFPNIVARVLCTLVHHRVRTCFHDDVFYSNGGMLKDAMVCGKVMNGKRKWALTSDLYENPLKYVDKRVASKKPAARYHFNMFQEECLWVQSAPQSHTLWAYCMFMDGQNASGFYEHVSSLFCNQNVSKEKRKIRRQWNIYVYAWVLVASALRAQTWEGGPVCRELASSLPNWSNVLSDAYGGSNMSGIDLWILVIQATL